MLSPDLASPDLAPKQDLEIFTTCCAHVAVRLDTHNSICVPDARFVHFWDLVNLDQVKTHQNADAGLDPIGLDTGIFFYAGVAYVGCVYILSPESHEKQEHLQSIQLRTLPEFEISEGANPF